jgi:hypothetical protein
MSVLLIAVVMCVLLIAVVRVPIILLSRSPIVLLIAVVRVPIILLSRPPIVAFIAVARAPIIPLSRPPIIVSILRVLIVHPSVEVAWVHSSSTCSRSCEEYSEIVARPNPAYMSSQSSI